MSSTSRTGPSLAAILENTDTHSPFRDWLAAPTRDFSARLALFSSLPDGPGPSPSSTSSHPHPTKTHSLHSNSSMARTCIHQSSNASNYPPSLLFTEATPTESSVSTGLASRCLAGVPLLEEVNGVLQRPQNQIRQPAFECSFWFLNCSYISYDLDEWKTHCLSHFRGEEPPRSVQCPLCEEFKYLSESGWDSWNRRMNHVAFSHHQLGHTLRTSRPDFALYHHLWQKRLIDDQDLKELKGGNYNLSRPPSNFVETNGNRGRREQRGQRRQHIGRVRQF